MVKKNSSIKEYHKNKKLTRYTKKPQHINLGNIQLQDFNHNFLPEIF